MKLTERLIKEHAEIREILLVVSSLAKDLKANRTFYANDVEIVNNYMFTYWINSHCKKEEKILFPALIKEGLITESEKINLVVEEHKFGQNYLNEINRCLENCKLGHPFSIDELSMVMKKFVDMLRLHMKNEEEYFFVLADKVINPEKQIHLLKECDLIDTALLKENKYIQNKEKFIVLEHKYLNKVSHN